MTGEGTHRTWGEAVAPLARKLRLAAALPGTSASWNSAGSKAFLHLLEEMVHKLDVDAPARISELRAERDTALDRLAEAEMAPAEARSVPPHRPARLAPSADTKRFSAAHLVIGGAPL